jgi:hypothetical protein
MACNLQNTGVCAFVWTRAGASCGTAFAWLEPDQKPSAKLAVFFVKQACSIEDGFDRNHYEDKNLTPPPRVPAPVEIINNEPADDSENAPESAH